MKSKFERFACALIALVWASGVHGQNADLVTVPLSDTELWLPSTRLLEYVAPSPASEGQWYLGVEGGLALYDAATATAEIRRLPQHSTIRAITPVGEMLWVATQLAGIHVFDPEPFVFVDTIERGQGPEGDNLRLQQDPFSGDLWVSRYHGLDRFDAESGQWHDLTGVFGKVRLTRPTWAMVLPDEDYIWINAIGPSSGLLRFERETGAWTLHRRALIGPEMRSRSVGIVTDVVSGERYVWVVVSAGNHYNFCIAVFDKAADSWRPYCRAEAVEAVDLLIDALPDVRWIERRDLLASMKELAEGAGDLSGDHPDRFSPDEVRLLQRAAERLDRAYLEHGLKNVSDHGCSRYSLHDARILDSGTVGKKPEEVARVHLPDVSFLELIAVDAKGKIIALTNDGLVRIDPDGWRLQSFDAPAVSIAWSNRVVTLDGGRSVVIVSAAPAFDGPPQTDIAWLSAEALEGRSIEPVGPGASHIGRVGDRLAVRTPDDGAVLVYDTEDDLWKPLPEETKEPFVEGLELPDSLDLPEGGNVRLESDGLVVSLAADDPSSGGADESSSAEP